MQPERCEPNYNPHGCCVNHWYRVPVVLDPTAKCDAFGEDEGDFPNKPSGGKFRRPFRHLDSCNGPATCPGPDGKHHACWRARLGPPRGAEEEEED